MKKIIIIGSGIGGSGIGALIAKHHNAEVTLFEKNNIIGGRCGSYIKKDDQGRKWVFDVGCHTMATCDKGPLGTILEKIGKKDSVKWSYTRNPEPSQNFMGMEIREKKKKKTKRTSKRIRLIDEIVKMSDEEIEKWNYISLQDFFNEKLGSGGAMQKLIHSLQAGLCFGDLPAEISAGEYLKSMKINALLMNHGSPVGGGYPMGGCGVIPETYCQCITENNGNIIMGKDGNVRKIIIENNEVKGVEAGPDKKFYEADIIISNSDIKTTVLNLVGKKFFSKEYVRYIKDVKWGVQVCTLKLGIDKVITNQKHITYVPPINQEDGMEQALTLIAGGINEIDMSEIEVPETGTLLIIPVSNHDPSLAPKGCQNIHTATPTSFGKIMNWDKKSDEKWRECCLNSLISLWPDLEDHIIISDFC